LAVSLVSVVEELLSSSGVASAFLLTLGSDFFIALSINIDGNGIGETFVLSGRLFVLSAFSRKIVRTLLASRLVSGVFASDAVGLFLLGSLVELTGYFASGACIGHLLADVRVL
jgi:hypothetical protein